MANLIDLKFSWLVQDNEITEERIIIKADSSLYFPGVETFRRTVNKVVLSSVPAKAGAPSASITIDLEHMADIDYTALKVTNAFKINYNDVSISEFTPLHASISKIFKNLSILQKYLNFSFLIFFNFSF